MVDCIPFGYTTNVMRKVPPPFGQVTGHKPGAGDGWH